MNRFMPVAPFGVMSVSQWLVGRATGLSAPGISTASNQSGCTISPPSTKFIGCPRSGSTRCCVKAAEPGPKLVPSACDGIDRHVGNLGARGWHQAVEERLLRFDADVGRRHEERHHVLVEQGLFVFEREAHQLTIDRRAHRTLHEALCGERRGTLRALLHAGPPAQPACAFDPALQVASGRVVPNPAQHQARGVDPGGIDTRGAGRVAPGLDEREVKLALYRLEQLEHMGRIPGGGELLPEGSTARAGAELLRRSPRRSCRRSAAAAPVAYRRRTTAAAGCRAVHRRGPGWCLIAAPSPDVPRARRVARRDHRRRDQHFALDDARRTSPSRCRQ